MASPVALADVALALRLGWTAALPAYLFLGAVCAVVSVIDVSTRRIPNRVVLPAHAIGGCLLAVASASDDEWSSLVRAALGMAVLGGFYLLLAVGFRGQMGFGDPLTELVRLSQTATIPRFGTAACSDRATDSEMRIWPCKSPDATPSSWWWRRSGGWRRSTIRGVASGWSIETAVRWTR